MGLTKFIKVPLAGLIFSGLAVSDDVCRQDEGCVAPAADSSADGHATGLREDDECIDETCSVNALQYHAKESRAKDYPLDTTLSDLTEVSAEKDVDIPLEAEVEGDLVEAKHHHHKHFKTKRAKEEAKHLEEMKNKLHRRRVSSHKFVATPIYDGPMQPPECNGTRLRRGHQGCCAGVPFNLIKEGCCGSVRYSTEKLSCCDHHDRTATLFNPYTSNCCDDQFKHNLQGGICDLQFGETSCCVVVEEFGRHSHGRHSRRRRRTDTTTTTISQGGADSADDSASAKSHRGPSKSEAADSSYAARKTHKHHDHKGHHHAPHKPIDFKRDMPEGEEPDLDGKDASQEESTADIATEKNETPTEKNETPSVASDVKEDAEELQQVTAKDKESSDTSPEQEDDADLDS